jgi:nucleoside 2-deoxyribosyltransferase
MMRVFIGGIMQGSHHPNVMSDQGYRQEIAAALTERWPEIEVVDPLALHPDGLVYDTEAARQTLLAMAALAAQCDLVIAYVPTASMGTALEMNAAYHAGIPVVAVSPMQHNWVVRAFASRIYPDLEGLYAAIRTAREPLALAAGDGAAP